MRPGVASTRPNPTRTLTRVFPVFPSGSGPLSFRGGHSSPIDSSGHRCLNPAGFLNLVSPKAQDLLLKPGERMISSTSTMRGSFMSGVGITRS